MIQHCLALVLQDITKLNVRYFVMHLCLTVVELITITEYTILFIALLLIQDDKLQSVILYPTTPSSRVAFSMQCDLRCSTVIPLTLCAQNNHTSRQLHVTNFDGDAGLKCPRISLQRPSSHLPSSSNEKRSTLNNLIKAPWFIILDKPSRWILQYKRHHIYTCPI
jgi:hypothetical protein